MNILVANTKGGVGKSFVSTQILPLAFDDNEINIFELDNNNKTTLNSSLLNFKNLNVNNIDEILLDVAFADEVVNIIDAGGGDDTKAVISALAENDVNIDVFIVPITRDFEVIKNLEDTIRLIKENYENPRIYVILNKVETGESVEEQFLYLFGNDEYGIDGVVDKYKDVAFVPIKNYKEIDIVKNIYKTTSADVINDGKEIVDSLKEYQQQWMSEAKEKYEKMDDQRKYFAKKMAFYRLIKKMLKIQDGIKQIFDFGNGKGGENGE